MDDQKILLKVKLTKPTAHLPMRATEGAAGYDLTAAESVIVPAAHLIGSKVSIGRALVSLGLSIAVPRNYVGRIGSRSGLSVKNNIEVGAGWIDSDYRGEVFVELKNLSSQDFVVDVGMRVAQLFLIPVGAFDLACVNELPPSDRGQNGFGSTGA